jgi:antitoxin MazE
MKTKLIRIGNSQGVRIPKPVIEEIGLSKEIEMILEDNQIILRSSEDARKNWDHSFEKMAENNDDHLLDQESVEKATHWGETEWTW